jgi:hypothetical protein
METGNTPRSTRDALILELLGDIGRIDDKITILEQRIDAFPETIASKIAPSVNAIAQAVNDAKAAVQHVGKTELDAFKAFTAQDKLALRDALKTTVLDEASAALAKAARQLANSAHLHVAAAKAESRRRWQWLLASVVGSLLSGLVVFIGMHWLYGEQLTEQAATGRAVLASWNSLDAKAQNLILESRKAAP